MSRLQESKADEARKLDSALALPSEDRPSWWARGNAGIARDYSGLSGRQSGQARWLSSIAAGDEFNVPKTPGPAANPRKRTSSSLRSFYTGIPKFTLRGKLQTPSSHLKG